jgi:phosphoadenosine phosphosulfate reductase
MHIQTSHQAEDQHNDAFPMEIDTLNRELGRRSAAGRVEWVLARYPGNTVLTSSFGAQAAVCLHLVSRLSPAIPVVLIDTGYLFPETYRYIDQLSESLALNLRVYRPQNCLGWQQALAGKLWEQGREGIETYNKFSKVEPMTRALTELGAKAWISGIRRQQSGSRSDAPVLLVRNGRLKVHPIVDWSDADVDRYMRQHRLPYHPLRKHGYVSIGDTHSTRRLEAGMAPEDTRFFGIVRECGLHTKV